MVSLAVAMGLGRFAFTPLLPMMLDEGSVDLAGASWLASANYLGYMIGALLCTLQPWIWSRIGGLPALSYAALVKAGLVATAVLTLAMAVPWPGTWPSLRFGAGIASAVVFVFTAGWCMARIARLGAPSVGGVIFAGPGLGIVISGLSAGGMAASNWTAAAGWLIFGLIAAALTATVWRTFRGGEERLAPLAKRQEDRKEDRKGDAAAQPPASGSRQVGGAGEMALLALSYGLAGFGYIITATFLPVIAREAIPDFAWLDLFWPIFGIGVVAGALLATRIPPGGDKRYLLAGAYVFQALGIALSLWRPTPAGFAIGSLMLGLPFTAITFFAMQEVRRLRESAAASFMGLLTATYGVGQIVGPPLVAILIARSATTDAGFTLSLQMAAAALLTGAAFYLSMIRIWPLRRLDRPAQVPGGVS